MNICDDFVYKRLKRNLTPNEFFPFKANFKLKKDIKLCKF